MTCTHEFGVNIGMKPSCWSDDQLLTMAGVDLKDENKRFLFQPAGAAYNLLYGNVKIGEFNVGPSFDYQRDTAVWEEQYDTTTNKFKFRLEVLNQMGRGRAPTDIRIKPAQYDPAWRLAWRYRTIEIEGTEQRAIEIARLDGRTFHVIDMLQKTDFDAKGEKWLRESNPITFHKHQTYITIHASDYMAYCWSVVRTPEKWSDAWPVRNAYLMSEQEAAWISRDWSPHASRLAPRPLPQCAHMSATALQGMLATLRRLAE
jgi:hypothetical protein